MLTAPADRVVDHLVRPADASPHYKASSAFAWSIAPRVGSHRPTRAVCSTSATRIVDEIDEVGAELEARRGEPGGSLRIGAPTEVGRRRITPLLAAFQRTYPKVRCELVLSDGGHDPMRDELDFVFRTTSPDDSGVVCLTLLRSRRVVCAALRLVCGRRVFDLWRFNRDGEPFEVRVGGSLSSTSGEVIYDWGLGGHGVALKAGWLNGFQPFLRTKFIFTASSSPISANHYGFVH